MAAVMLFSGFLLRVGGIDNDFRRARELHKRGEATLAIRIADSALDQALAQKKPDEILEALLFVNTILREQNENEKALTRLYQVLDSARKMGYRKIQAVALGKIGELFYDLGQLDEAIRYYDASLAVLKDTGWIREEIECINGRAMAMALKGQWEEAMADFTRSLSYFDNRRLDDPILLSKTHNYCGLILNRFSDYDNARNHFETALVIAEKFAANDLMARYTNNLALTYKNENRDEEATNLLQKGLEISRKAKDKKQEFVAHLSLGDLASKARRYQVSYDHYNQAYDLNSHLKNRQAQAILLLKRGSAFFDDNRTEQARSDLEAARVIAEEIGNRDALDHIYRKLITIHKKQGDIEPELLIHEKLEKLSETIFDPEISGAIHKIRAQYETEKMLKRIDREKSLWYRLLIVFGGLGLLSLSTAALIWLNRIRLKKKMAGLVRQKEEQIRQQSVQIRSLQEKIDEYFAEKGKQKYKGSQLSDTDSRFYLDCLQELMNDAELYLDNGLTLSKLAKHMKMHPKILSQLINSETGGNFNEYINSFRIMEARRLLENRDCNGMTILEIAYDSGFNSKSTFNLLFRKEIGISPKQYREEYNEKRQE